MVLRRRRTSVTRQLAAGDSSERRAGPACRRQVESAGLGEATQSWRGPEPSGLRRRRHRPGWRGRQAAEPAVRVREDPAEAELPATGGSGWTGRGARHRRQRGAAERVWRPSRWLERSRTQRGSAGDAGAGREEPDPAQRRGRSRTRRSGAGGAGLGAAGGDGGGGSERGAGLGRRMITPQQQSALGRGSRGSMVRPTGLGPSGARRRKPPAGWSQRSGRGGAGS